MKFFLKPTLALILASFLFIGCEKQEYFKSKKGIDSQLQGNWKRVRISASDPSNQIWNFNDGSITITSGKDTVTGSYSVHTTLFKVFFTTDKLPGNCTDHGNPTDMCKVSAKWQVIILDDEVLDIATDGCGGVIENEFSKQ